MKIYSNEGIESNDANQFKVVSNKSQVDNLCDNIKNNVDLTGFKKLHFEKLSKEEKTRIQETMYHMMWTLKKVPIEITKKLPRRLRILIDQRWFGCLLNERNLREATLAQLLIDLGSKEMKKHVEKHRGKFNLKYQAFKILQGKFDEVAHQTKQKWKVIFGFSLKAPT